MIRLMRPALMVALAIACQAFVGADTVAAAAKSVYLRVAFGANTTIYVQVRGPELRMATSPAGLQKAAQVRGKYEQRSFLQFPSTAMPVPASALPAGCVEVRLNLYLHLSKQVPTSAFVEIGQTHKDDKGSAWSYWVSEGGVDLGSAPARAPLVHAPEITGLRLDVITSAEGKSVGAGVRVRAGATEISDITKDGKPARVAQITITDAAGKTIGTKAGTLTDLGFG